MRKNNIAIFLAFSFFLSWGICAALYFSGFWLLPYGFYGLSLCMLAPAAALLLTKLITREGWHDIGFRLQLRGHIRFYLLACFGPTILIFLGGALFFLINPGSFDASAFGVPIHKALLTMLLSAVLSPLMNIIFCTGEEIGWRGYLVPQLLKKHGITSTILLSGLIWGLWHAPMIAMGHNYGLNYPGWPWLGIIAMIIFCIALGSFFSYVSQRTGSFWPAALAHGALNGMASSSLLFVKPGTEYGVFINTPLPVGLVGGSFLLLAGIICWILLYKQHQPKHKLLIATGNAHKAEEIAAIFAKQGVKGWQYISLADFPDYRPPEETGHTFRENALLKATHAAEMSGLITLADDSGLSVEALGGAPGVYSARYAGEQCDDAANRRKLLLAMENIPDEARCASFICAACVAFPDAENCAEAWYADGCCPGFITHSEHGENGFGYDSLFFLPQFNATMAELSAEQKNEISHRGKAMKQIAQMLTSIRK